ncbi:glycosyltransferase family 25 protein [Bradyrhizobium sp. OK095]|jgi:GR25 family glycosyltransferase involved in LPS biosynthesis|uniref:glycosyltransferase family 25 protein n=1 Tax=Bradyrhizobium sp. OK095 TaxID=1882760 RepID=UPI0008D51806|nr:glycosyltransferase family 25 protein [Bradyrhizobium sp. OK095]SEN15018.1 Glycosyltransferase involved in LPS biosynthesis, GR25 family [Bradyrhizobium sp. OK095]
MKNFVINLDRHPEKFENFLRRNAGCGIAFERFSATNGLELTDQEVMAMRLVAPGSQFTRGAVGGAASLWRILNWIAKQNEPALVFEDDCTIRYDIIARLEALLPSLDSWDLLVLGYNTDSVLDLELAQGMKSMMVFRPVHPDDASDAAFQRSNSQVAAFRLNCCFGPAGTAISPAGASRLLELCFPMDNRPVRIEALGNRMLPTIGLDGMGNSTYRFFKAYACFAPLVVPRNNNATSTTYTHDARVWG